MQTTIIDFYEAFSELKDYVASNNFEYVVIDTETNSKSEKLAKLYGIGICFEDHEAFYFPIRNQDGTSFWNANDEMEIRDWIFELCSTKKLIGHNYIYDALVLYYNWGFDTTPFLYSDTILQKHTVDEERPFGLKEVAVKYLGEWANKAQQAMIESVKANGGKTTKDNFEMYKCDMPILAEYCCWDVLLTKKLFDIFEPRLKAEGLYDLFYKDEVMPLYKEVTIPMKKSGFNVDVVYFQELNSKIEIEIKNLEQKVNSEISHLIAPLITQNLNKHYPIKRTGLFPKYAADIISFSLPLAKTGKVTLAEKELNKLPIPTSKNHLNYLNWLKGLEELDQDLALDTQHHWFYEDNKELSFIFNLKSNDDLKWLFFQALGEKPLAKTDGGDPKVDEALLEEAKTRYPWVQTLIDYKKLNKLKSTYIEGILERQIDSIIYSSFLQFGTNSGRYSSTDPNLQNLPRIKEDDSNLSSLVLEYVNSIKKGFVAPKGYLLVNADYSQLEPRAFAEASGDTLLQEAYINNEDLYGSIAVRVFKLDCKPNEVKKKYPEARQKSKIIALAVVYGAEAGRISQIMKIEYMEAQKIIDDYLNAYPGLKSYMSNCNRDVCTKGFVATKFGRIRHLPEAKILYNLHGLQLLDKKWSRSKGLDETRYKFKSMLNLSKNYKIQGVAAHIVNRAAIAISKRFRIEGIEGCLIAQVHDELTCAVREDQAEQAKKIVKDCMENTTKISVPLVAEPLIALNWAEAK